MSKDNLIPGAHKLTREENRLGGINSGISRRERKRAIEIARDILSMPVGEGAPKDVSEVTSLKELSEITSDVITVILAKMAQRAIDGDIQACKTLLTISGDFDESKNVVVNNLNKLEDYEIRIHVVE